MKRLPHNDSRTLHFVLLLPAFLFFQVSLGEAEALWAEMKRRGVAPTRFSYNAVRFFLR